MIKYNIIFVAVLLITLSSVAFAAGGGGGGGGGSTGSSVPVLNTILQIFFVMIVVYLYRNKK